MDAQGSAGPKPRTNWTRRCWLGGAVLLLSAAVFFGLSGFVAYTNFAYVDLNTGSRRGHREWLFGLTTGRWENQSALETFIRKHHANEFRQRWVSYMGTGRNFFGRSISFGHGDPGVILSMNPRMLDEYVAQSDARAKKALYDLFLSRDEKRIEAEGRRILDWWLVPMNQPAPPETPPAP